MPRGRGTNSAASMRRIDTFNMRCMSSRKLYLQPLDSSKGLGAIHQTCVLGPMASVFISTCYNSLAGQ